MFASRLARRPLLTLTTAGAATTLISATVYTNSDRGLGLKREINFWSTVTPVVFDYWWNCFDSSPKVAWKRRIQNAGDADAESSDRTEAKDALLKELHERNAPIIYNTMLRLGGLYIKLGQVLSVTALPIPETYREYFRTMQDTVPHHEYSEIQPTLEAELGDLNAIFDSIEEDPCGAASIGQAHRATLKSGEEVVIKVQYPASRWQVPADIECIGDLLKLCVWFGVVDESAATLSYEEFARQFLSELDYVNEMNNLRDVYASSLDPRAPYMNRGVVLPRVFDELCTERVITMSYLKGRKFEEEMRRQLSLIGVDTKRSMHDIIKESGNYAEKDDASSQPLALSSSTLSWKVKLSSIMSNFVGVDFLFSMVRFSRRIMLLSQSATIKWIQWAPSFMMPNQWKSWADKKQLSRLDWTEEALNTLLDVHGYQILNQGLFNADPHPGNILLDFPSDAESKPTIGLIDYGQCKRLTATERVQIARLILSIADRESDAVIADHFRNLGIKTKNDSTRFLADFGRLMFGSFEAKHLDHSWHKELHKEDRVLYFPNELSMVYRTALLLRGLAMSLQYNPSVGEVWKVHALEVIKFHG